MSSTFPTFPDFLQDDEDDDLRDLSAGELKRMEVDEFILDAVEFGRQ